jgi:adenylate kinase
MIKQKKVFRLAIIGPSGGGKGTQAKLLSKSFSLKHISVGKLIREEIRESTPLGKRIARIVNAGRWLPTELVFKILKPVLDKALDGGFILDGFPREVGQAILLDRYLQEHNLQLDFVFWLKVRPEVIYQRRRKIQQQGRSFYDEKRGDESEKAIRLRIKEYQRTISPIVDFYRQRRILREINGERPISQIYQDILKYLSGEKK